MRFKRIIRNLCFVYIQINYRKEIRDNREGGRHEIFTHDD